MDAIAVFIHYAALANIRWVDGRSVAFSRICSIRNTRVRHPRIYRVRNNVMDFVESRTWS